MEAWRARVLTAAQSWLGTPWQHNQAVMGAGIDCGHYLLRAYVEADCAEPAALGEYPNDWMLHRDEERFLVWVERYCDKVDQPQPADIVLWRFGRCFSHGAIVVEWPLILHAYLPQRAVVWGDAERDGHLLHRVAKGGSSVPRERLFYSRAARIES